MSFSEFFDLLLSLPALWVVVLLTLGVILVNGWTDAPNAIATCVATRAIKPRTAILMAAVFNFLGVFVMTMWAPKVTETISKMVNFGENTHEASIALSAAMFAIVVWAVMAWAFGIPTSESHALIAGLTGAAIALHGNLDGVNGEEWIKVVWGIGVSLVLGFGFGYLITKIIQRICKRMDYRRLNSFFAKGQVVAAAGTAFMHGAQDGQKFIGVFLLGLTLVQGTTGVTTFVTPMWLMVLCSAVMALGTSIGGMKIIKSVGMDMVKLEKYQGFSADIAASAGLLVCSMTGLPVSTTHAKTISIMGVGAAKRFRSVNWGVAKEMALTWILTFPGCGLVGFLMTKLFMFIF